ncbi:unnamed protein product [Owenia fusiformis]|uniref:SUI1 domain-containing protein n=1 Tax=Owenia fusiformis TaxID=6347 RepID=A0A8S4MZL6_OWEFU|nr:unnamed protein product [Owenia fusiformis]
MFHKPFKVRSQTAIKGSDRKKLRANVEKQFPNAAGVAAREIIPNKEEMTVTKIYTHSGDGMLVYSLQKMPIFFEYEKDKIVHPTVYTLWRYPDMLPVLTTGPPVLDRMVGGADLMLPGVIVREPVTPYTFKHLSKGQIVAVDLYGNRAPVAVGKMAMSGSDMFEVNMKGKGVIILHVLRDQLWLFGDKSMPPHIPYPDVTDNGDITTDNVDDITTESDDKPKSEDIKCNATSSDIQDNEDGVEQVTGSIEELNIVEDAEDEVEDTRSESEIQDELLFTCFMCALKDKVNAKTDLPLLTSEFFRSYMVPYCPPGKEINVKKSSYKKLSKFLKSMQTEGIIKVQELSKGVDSLTDIYKQHPRYREFVIPEDIIDAQNEIMLEEEDCVYEPPKIQEMYMVNGNTMELFKIANCKKGDALSTREIREILKKHVKENELQNETGRVVMDPVLTDAVLGKASNVPTLRWDEMIQKCQARMAPCYSITYPGQTPIIKKGSVDPITITIAKRMGNKKVTLVENLENFGIDPKGFGQEVKVGVASSVSLSKLPGTNRGKERGLQVLVQGNQINFIADLLLETFQIPRKFLIGLEKAPKVKKTQETKRQKQRSNAES